MCVGVQVHPSRASHSPFAAIAVISAGNVQGMRIQHNTATTDQDKQLR
jgi:hypothetical protein